MREPRRRLLAGFATTVLAPLASGCATDSRDDTATTATTSGERTTPGESSTTDPPPTTDSCEPPAGDLVSDLNVQDDRENRTPFTVTITRSDDTVVYEATYGSGDSTGWDGRLFDETTYYTVDVDVEDGPSASQSVSVTGEDWMRRYGVSVVVEAASVSISTYHGDPVCP